MLERLHATPFNAMVRGDENRQYNAMLMRNRSPIFTRDESPEPSIFEVLVSLAISCEFDIMHDDEKGNRTSEWFWMMMRNLGLDQYMNIRCETDLNSFYDINNIIYIFNNRKYKRDGSCGGAFPLNDTHHRDLRHVDLWYQMNWYLVENFNYELQ